MRSSGPFEDRFAVQDLYSTYADASSRGDREVWLSLWADDAWWKTHLFEREGKAAITEQWDSIHDDLMTIAFLSQWGPIAVDGDRAAARSYVREIVRMWRMAAFSRSWALTMTRSSAAAASGCSCAATTRR